MLLCTANQSVFQLHKYDEERQVTKPTSPLQSCRLRTGFWHSRSRFRAVARGCIIPLEIMTTYIVSGATALSGNVSAEIRYVNGSFVVGTSASSPGVLRHICIVYSCMLWRNYLCQCTSSFFCLPPLNEVVNVKLFSNLIWIWKYSIINQLTFVEFWFI